MLLQSSRPAKAPALPGLTHKGQQMCETRNAGGWHMPEMRQSTVQMVCRGWGDRLTQDAGKASLKVSCLDTGLRVVRRQPPGERAIHAMGMARAKALGQW